MESCSPLGSNASRLLARYVMYDFWLPLSNRRRTSIKVWRFAGLCTILRAVCRSTVFLLSEQNVLVVCVGVYEGASALRLICLVSGGWARLSGRLVSVLCLSQPPPAFLTFARNSTAAPNVALAEAIETTTTGSQNLLACAKVGYCTVC